MGEDLLKIINHYGVIPQLKHYYDISGDDIKAIFEMKLDRQIERIKNENN